MTQQYRAGYEAAYQEAIEALERGHEREVIGVGNVLTISWGTVQRSLVISRYTHRIPCPQRDQKSPTAP